jgi:hypothetical protein
MTKETLHPFGVSDVEKKSETHWRYCLFVVVFFSIAMAWVESAAVAYLRILLNRVEPYQPTPLPVVSFFGATELIREAGTVVMLLSVAWLAGKSWRGRFGYFMTAFGVWDVFYYIFLKAIVGWPHSLFDWDVLFLLPLPWWGPVLSPLLISIILIVGGVLSIRTDGTLARLRPSRNVWILCLAGVTTALYVFMADSIHAIGEGASAIQHLLPTDFNWPLFIGALAMMGAPIIDIALQFWRAKKERE